MTVRASSYGRQFYYICANYDHRGSTVCGNGLRGLLRRQTPLSRQVLSWLLNGRIAWTPRKDEGLYEFAGRVKFDKLLSGIVVTRGMVAVRGFEPRSRG